ncbi:amidase, partial [Protomyces lactucae-debilis]
AAKENICSIQGFTTCASQILGAADSNAYASPFDATCIKLLNAAGARLTQKTNMDEFGMGSFSANTPFEPVRNPHNALHVAGGSSGGSAATLFAEDGPQFSLGTDTGGSVRQPASHCGVWGFKPSYGRISRLGVVSYANSFDTVGILARELGTIRQVYQVLDQHDPADPTSLADGLRKRIATRQRRPGRIRVGIPVEYNVSELSDEIRTLWRKAATSNEQISCHPVSIPLTRAALSAYSILVPSEASSNLQKYSGLYYGARAEADRSSTGLLYAETRSLFGPEVERRILMGNLSLSAARFNKDFLQACRIRRLLLDQFSRVFRQPHPILPSPQQQMTVDFLLTPVATTPAPTLEEARLMGSAEERASDVMTVPASMAGLPSISIPSATSENGLPIGLQLIGQYGEDEALLEAAK